MARAIWGSAGKVDVEVSEIVSLDHASEKIDFAD